MLKIKNYILFCLFALASVSVMAQRPTVRVTVQPSDILIGEQAVINLEVISPKGRDIQFPTYADTIVRGVEVLQMMKVDTTMTEVMTLSQKYIITSFDSTLYHIPYMEVYVDQKDTIRSNSFGLKVSSPGLSEQTLAYLEKLKKQETDSLNFDQLEIRDIKDIQVPPFVITDYLPEILAALAILFLIAAIVVAIVFWRRKKKKGYFFTPKVVLPPHVVALNGLNELKSKKLSQRGMEKEYYTEISDIVRVYISKRYPTINATEMLTEDILRAVHRATDSKSPEEGLAQILRIADLVKFAKYTPLTDENDLSMVNAYLFVNQTKLEEVEQPIVKTPKGMSGIQIKSKIMPPDVPNQPEEEKDDEGKNK